MLLTYQVMKYCYAKFTTDRVNCVTVPEPENASAMLLNQIHLIGRAPFIQPLLGYSKELRAKKAVEKSS